MTVELELAPDVEARLREFAAEKAISPEAAVVEVVTAWTRKSGSATSLVDEVPDYIQKIDALNAELKAAGVPESSGEELLRDIREARGLSVAGIGR